MKGKRVLGLILGVMLVLATAAPAAAAPEIISVTLEIDDGTGTITPHTGVTITADTGNQVGLLSTLNTQLAGFMATNYPGETLYFLKVVRENATPPGTSDTYYLDDIYAGNAKITFESGDNLTIEGTLAYPTIETRVEFYLVGNPAPFHDLDITVPYNQPVKIKDYVDDYKGGLNPDTGGGRPTYYLHHAAFPGGVGSATFSAALINGGETVTFRADDEFLELYYTTTPTSSSGSRSGSPAVYIENIGGGTTDPVGTLNVQEGDNLTININPSPGCYLAKVEMGGKTYRDVGKTFTLTNIQGSTAVYFYFEEGTAPTTQNPGTGRL